MSSKNLPLGLPAGKSDKGRCGVNSLNNLLKPKKTIHLDLPDAEIHALVKVRKTFFNNPHSIELDWIAHWLLLLILQKPAVIDALYKELAKYREAEDMDDHVLLVSRVAANSAYRKTKI